MRRGAEPCFAYPSCRQPGVECVALLYPDLVANAIQGRHLDYHWDGARVDVYREQATGAVYRITAET